MNTLIHKLFWLSLFIPMILSCKGQTQEKRTKVGDSIRVDTCSLLFVGDVMSHTPQVRAAYQKTNDSYDYSSCFDSIKSLVQGVDLAVANLETPLAGKPYRGYPMFSAPDALAEGLKNAGFDLMGTCNNHSADRGRNGLIRTLDVLDRLGLKHFGSYRNRGERENTCPLIMEVKGIRLAFLAYTYGTNGMPIPKPTVIDTIKREQIVLDLAKADSLKVDYKIIFIHWGQEYQHQANQEQKDLARWLHQQNVDAVIGSHPHVVQGTEYLRDSLYHDTLVAYSLGNFISNQNSPSATRGGMMLSLRLIKKTYLGTESLFQAKTKLQDIAYNFAFVNKRTPKGKAIYQLRLLSLDNPMMPNNLPKVEQKSCQGFINYLCKYKYKQIPPNFP